MDAFARLAALVPSYRERPCLVGITGPVAAGKTTAASRLAAALAPRRAVVISTDGFLMTNAELGRRGSFQHKGHPDTYDVAALTALIGDVRGGRKASVPVYSHLAYDRVEGAPRVVDPEDVVIVEGLHLLHDRLATVRESLDLSVYLDAADADLEAWFLERLRALVTEAQGETGAFEFFRELDPEASDDVGRTIWRTINAPNNARYVAPTRPRADVVLEQGADHSIVAIRTRRQPGEP